jgi:transcription elongation factor Elf1
MGRRRRTKIQMRPRPKLPNIFDCPLCSKKAISISFDKDPYIIDIICSNCGKTYHYTNPSRLPVKFGCPNCNEKSVSIEFVEATNSIRIICSECKKSVFESAREWENDPDTYSIVRLVPGGAKLGCPNCGFRTITIKVKVKKDYALIQCGACGVKDIYPITPLDEKVDVYGRFIDTIKSNIKVIERMKPSELADSKDRVERYKDLLETKPVASLIETLDEEEETEEDEEEESTASLPTEPEEQKEEESNEEEDEEDW